MGRKDHLNHNLLNSIFFFKFLNFFFFFYRDSNTKMASLMQIASKMPRHTLTTALKTTWPPTIGAKTTIANSSSTMPIQVPSAFGRSFGTSSRFFGLKEPKAHGPKDPRTGIDTMLEKGLYYCCFIGGLPLGMMVLPPFAILAIHEVTGYEGNKGK